jgi:large subunit ribosomal protein L9
MEVLLLSDIKGIGKKNDLIVVGNGFALNCLIPERKALVATPNVRRRYAEEIKKRALEREQELSMRRSVLGTLTGKSVTITKKTTKTGKLYAAVSTAMVQEAFKAQHGIEIREQDMSMDEIKSVGKHPVKISVGDQSVDVTVDVKAE